MQRFVDTILLGYCTLIELVVIYILKLSYKRFFKQLLVYSEDSIVSILIILK